MATILHEESEKKLNKKHNKLYILLFFTISLLTLYLVFSYVYYIDISNGCLIKLNSDPTNPNSNSLRQSLQYIKNETSEYKNVCGSINKINEMQCLSEDPRVTNVKYTPSGCFVKGTKTIYVLPSYFNSINEQGNDIVKYAEYAKNYLEQK